ncbi:hypothetical protein [Paenibacillus sp. B1-33]
MKIRTRIWDYVVVFVVMPVLQRKEAQGFFILGLLAIRGSQQSP